MQSQQNLQARIMKTRRYLENITRDYYRKRQPSVPPDFRLREFAAQTWTGRSYIRHLSFQSTTAIHKFLVEKAPRHFYYSSARYDQPGIDDMDAKGWRSADIVFDIDADHLPECSNMVVEVETPLGEKASFIDEKCIRYAALRSIILRDILVEEIGIDEKKIVVEFSGNRGFHVTVYLQDTDELARAGPDVRRELVNYIKAVGLLDEILEPWRGLNLRKGRPSPVPPSIILAGARGRLARIMYRLAEASGRRDLARLLAGREPIDYAVYQKQFAELEVRARELLGVEIDEQVTVDTRRLIRAPWSINGKTGLLVVPVEYTSLYEFSISERLSPFTDLDPIRIEVIADVPSNITVLGNRIRLRRGDKPRLPAPVAVYLLSKGVAVVA
ncbi:DNA primase small subunit domain-containing protein [Pyrodictium delaneyi]|uniref:DNA primase small subunit PriS n=1 Tax=Pyrodictium delaneyi TaxID=1273541 RepID=A0A211YLV2_9CREN|nr:DNA primase small subunit domain-containing protein [Pyrodictium delaneyi]OWJ54025.1 hypothetical protein Pdsh_09135 [Pyrodictium delaneyi]